MNPSFEYEEKALSTLLGGSSQWMVQWLWDPFQMAIPWLISGGDPNH